MVAGIGVAVAVVALPFLFVSGGAIPFGSVRGGGGTAVGWFINAWERPLNNREDCQQHTHHRMSYGLAHGGSR